MTEELPPPLDPNPGEIVCLSVLWQAHEEGLEALRLSEIHDRIRKRCEAIGESPPAPTTVSTYLRSAVSKRLLEEVRQGPGHSAIPLHVVRTRGALVSSRSPQTAYRAVFLPSKVFRNTFAALIQAYPSKLRHEAILDFARAANLESLTLDERFLILFKLFRILRFDELPNRERNALLIPLIQSWRLDQCDPASNVEHSSNPARRIEEPGAESRPIPGSPFHTHAIQPTPFQDPAPPLSSQQPPDPAIPIVQPTTPHAPRNPGQLAPFGRIHHRTLEEYVSASNQGKKPDSALPIDDQDENDPTPLAARRPRPLRRPGFLKRPRSSKRVTRAS